MNISEIIGVLEHEYGKRQWRPTSDPLSELVATILSQNTSDVNSRRAYHKLRANFGSWEAVAEASVAEIERAIRCGGLAGIKAQRIKSILHEIRQKRGNLELGFLERLPLNEAKRWLMNLPGVGPKTASCVLLFSLGLPALPVDTHVYRVAQRLGLIDSRVSPQRAHEILEGLVPPQHIYRFHVYLLEHGRLMCKAQRPRCPSCVFRESCPSAVAALAGASQRGRAAHLV